MTTVMILITTKVLSFHNLNHHHLKVKKDNKINVLPITEIVIAKTLLLY